MKAYKFIGIAILVLTFTSCHTYSYTSRMAKVSSSNITSTYSYIDVTPDYTRQVQAQSGWHRTERAARQDALYTAIVSSKIDVVVDPIFKIERSGRRVKAYVVGYAGKYENSRTLIEQIKSLNNVSMEDIEKYLLLRDPGLIQYFKSNSSNSVIINNAKETSAQ